MGANSLIALFFIFQGIFLIGDGVVSIIVRQENKTLPNKFARMYQPGRVIRCLFGLIDFIIGVVLLI